VRLRGAGVCSDISPTGGVTVSITATPNNFTPGSIATTGQTLCSGGSVNQIGNAAVASGGDGVITYEWRRNGTAIADANGAAYTPSAYAASGGTFTRWAKDNTCTTTLTQSAGQWVLNVVTPPDAPSLTQNGPVCAGSYITFTVSGGSGSYEWTGAFSGSGTTKTTSTSAGAYTAQVRSVTTSGSVSCYSDYSSSVSGTINGQGSN
jgi:hypothetical protein